jgi:hypothetical protein
MNTPRLSGAIGGYFELELPRGAGELYPAALKYQSARAAFASLLQHVRPRRIWMPWYNCDTMLEAPETAGVAVRRYGLDSDLYPEGLDALAPDDCLLYVNYFGVCGRQVSRLLREFAHERVIIDHSQAFYAPPPDCLGTLYSPRKFFGVPDGGYLLTRIQVQPPPERDTQSFERLEPLMVRFSEGPEAGYGAIQKARISLKGQSPKAMSALTEAMLHSIDYPRALLRRNENFMMLHTALGSRNRFPIPADIPDGPMCYPFFGEITHLHAWLIQHRVFVGHYWPGVRGPLNRDDELEQRLSQQCVPLPCDQRYGSADMERIIAQIDAFRDAHLHRLCWSGSRWPPESPPVRSTS